MSNAAIIRPVDASGPYVWRKAWALVGAVTAARLGLLALNRTDLFVDEAQYWAWGQALDWGYYSKPPLIAWVIRAVTALSGSDAALVIRAPGALFHGATALILAACGAQLFGARAVVPVALGYVTLPFVALGSLLISTDTILAPFYAAAILFWLRMGQGGWRDAVLCGCVAGLAVMAKYAGLYLLPTLAMAALLSPAFRVRWELAALAVGVAILVIAPNIAWNVAHDMTTLDHTLDNVDWVRDDPQGSAGWNVAGLAAFAAGQFAVFGPVAFGALVWLAWRGRGPVRALVAMALAVVALICVQALLSRAYANWAVTAYFAASIAVMPWLAQRPGLWRASLAVNGAICVILPLLTVFPDARTTGRYMGRSDLSAQILGVAQQTRARAIVAEHRDVLADLWHTGRDAGLPLYAAPPRGKPDNWFAQNYALPAGAPGPMLWIKGGEAAPCAGGRVVATLNTDGGAYDGRVWRAWLLPDGCVHVGQ